MNSDPQPAGRGLAEDIPPLRQLYFYLTEGCNLACSHCWLSPVYDPDCSRLPFLPLDLMARIIAEAGPLGLTGVKLTGGEPLLHPDILSILYLLRTQKLELTMETNGVLCSEKIAAAIAALPSSFVSVSLDAVDSKTHDRLRGKAGAYDGTIRAIRTLADHGITTQIIMSLMRDNVAQLEQMILLAAELGADSLKLNLVQPIGRGRKLHTGDKTLNVAELIALARQVETELVPRSPIPLFFDCPPAFKSLRLMAPGGGGCSVCGIFSVLGVLANGSYALCGIGSRISELTFGRAGKDSLAGIWQSHPILREIRGGLPAQLTGICSRCLMRHNCLGSCIANNYYRTGSLWAPFWFCEEAEALGMFPESRTRLRLGV